MKKYYKIIIMLASFAGMVLSITLLKHHLDPNFKSPLCGISESNGCNVLNRSSASEIFGIPLAYWGFLYYGFIFFMGVFSEKLKSLVPLIFLMSLVAIMADIGLFLYSVFVAETICVLCSITYAMTIIIIIVSYFQMVNLRTGFIPDFSEIKKLQVPFSNVILLVILLIPVTGGYFYHAFATGNSSIGNHGTYLDHLAIAENEYIKAYENQPVINFHSEPDSKKGPSRALVNIVEFADFLCPHCKIMSETLDHFAKKYPDEVSVTYRHFPLDQACNPAITRAFHQGSCILSYASYCGLKQNKFWEMHNAIFNLQTEFEKTPVTKDTLLNVAARIGLNKSSMEACFDDKETKQAIALDVQEANELGINGTPTIYINGRKMDYNDHLMERLLAYLKQKSLHENGH